MPKRTRSYRSKLLEDLRDPAKAVAYVNAALEDSEEAFLIALRDVAEGRMAKVAEDAGLTREALYRTLSEEGNPRFSSLVGVLGALGMKISIEAQAVLPAVVAPTYIQVRADEATQHHSISRLAHLVRHSRRAQVQTMNISSYANS